MSTDTQPATRVRPFAQPRNAWAIVTRREVVTKLTDKAFLSGTLITLLLIIGLAVISVVMDARGSSRSTSPKSRPRAAARSAMAYACLLYTSPSPRDKRQSRMPSSA